jgi:hypothetical protein
MLQKLRDLYRAACELGFRVPFAYDSKAKEPSFTLLVAYTATLLTIVSLIALHLKLDLVIATITTMTYWVVAMIFYLIRNLNKAKVDLDDHSIDLEGSKEDEEKK